MPKTQRKLKLRTERLHGNSATPPYLIWSTIIVFDHLGNRILGKQEWELPQKMPDVGHHVAHCMRVVFCTKFPLMPFRTLQDAFICFH